MNLQFKIIGLLISLLNMERRRMIPLSVPIIAKWSAYLKNEFWYEGNFQYSRPEVNRFDNITISEAQNVGCVIRI